MKKQILITGFMVLSTLLLNSCSKQDDAGIQIDGNGRPRTNQANVNSGSNLTGKSSGSCIDPNGNPAGKDSALSDYGIAIDPDGKP